MAELPPQEFAAAVALLPKVNPHRHLESMRPQQFVHLARVNNVEEFASMEAGDAARMYSYPSGRAGFGQFLDLFGRFSSVIRTGDDVLYLLRELAEEAQQQNIAHTDLTITPYTLSLNGLDEDELLDALGQGRALIPQLTGGRCTVSLTVDISCGDPRKGGEDTVAMAIKGRRLGIIGALGMGGSERRDRVARWGDLIETYLPHGPFSPHAGEAAGPNSMWEMLRYDTGGGEVPSMAHGFRAIGDRALVTELARRGTLLQVCPTSNFRTGTIKDIRRHPLPKLLAAGVNCAVGTDDDPMLRPGLDPEDVPYRGNDITTELIMVNRLYGISFGQIVDMTYGAAEAALIPPNEQAALKQRITSGLAGAGLGSV